MWRDPECGRILRRGVLNVEECSLWEDVSRGEREDVDEVRTWKDTEGGEMENVRECRMWKNLKCGRIRNGEWIKKTD